MTAVSMATVATFDRRPPLRLGRYRNIAYNNHVNEWLSLSHDLRDGAHHAWWLDLTGMRYMVCDNAFGADVSGITGADVMLSRARVPMRSINFCHAYGGGNE